MEAQKLKQFARDGKSTRQMAQETGKSQTTIRYWLKKFGIKGRNEHNLKRGYVCKYCGVEGKKLFVWRSKNRQCKSVCIKCHTKLKIERIRKYKRIAVESKGGKCQKCGYNRCVGALDFHHSDPNKKDPQWQTMRSCSLGRILNEISKCDLLCANCHREIHWGGGEIGITSPWHGEDYGFDSRPLH